MKSSPSTSFFKQKVQLPLLAWGFLAVIFILPGLLAGGFLGYGAAGRKISEAQTKTLQAQIEEQYDLGLQEMEDGAYARAAQRFEWILLQEPNHEGAIEHMADALVALYTVEEQVPDPLTPTPTAGEPLDLQAASEHLAKAKSAIDAADWPAALEQLVLARQVDPGYEAPLVDRYLYLSLRQNGVRLILNQSELEGGLYHLALAERFAPIDFEADNVRSWARLYLIGASFWGVFPDRAAYYFGQLAEAAPYLSDSSGIPAIDRYFSALVQYGNQLFEAEDWCAAADQYGLALGVRYDAEVEARQAEAVKICEDPDESGPEESPTPDPALLTGTPTETPTPGLTTEPPPEEITPTPTLEPTIEPTVEPTIEPTEEPSPTPAP